ncbi:MAG: AMP-binding protein, partial [Chthoniobacterales bacterium]
IRVFDQLIADPDRPLHEISLLLKDEPTLTSGPESAPAFRSLVPQCLHQLFDETAGEFGDQTALDSAADPVTFETLNAQANQVARHLRKLNVAAKSTVALDLGSSPHWPAVVLGVWKAGAAILLHGDPKSLSTRQTPKLLLAEDPAEQSGATPLADFWEKATSEKTRPIPGDISASDPAIRLPDGRSLSHEDAAHLCQSAATALTVEHGDRLLQAASAHDLDTVLEIFGTLLVGASVVLPPIDGWSTRTAFQEFADEHAVSLLSLPATFWSQWTHYLSELTLPAPASVRRAVIRGGRVAPAALTAWRTAAPVATLLHAGAGFHAPSTEIEPTTTFSPPLPAQPPAGALARVTWQDSPLPPGFPGRLEIGTSKATLTSTDEDVFLDRNGSFYPRNEVEAVLRPGSPTSRLETLEQVIFEHPEIFDCTVAPTDSGSWKIWVVPADSQRGEPIDFRDHLSAHLPDLDFAVACLPRMPLTSSGQIDHDALPRPTSQAFRPKSTSPDTPPSPSEEDEKLLSILSRALSGRELDLDTSITDGSSKPRVARHLHDTLTRSGYEAALLEDFEHPFSVRSLRREWRSRESANKGRWTPLQPLHAAGANPPLIVIHDLPGTIELYRELTLHLGEDQPVYAIAARPVGNPPEPASVDEMADTYAAAILSFDADGPHRLLGFGFGGTLALETARRLVDQGHEVDFLALLATEPPRASRGLTSGLKKFFGKKSAPTPRPGDTPALTAHRQAAFRHKFEPYDLTTHIFLPEEDFLDVEQAQDDWVEICDDARFYQIPCSPSDLLEEPAITAIADAVTNLLRTEHDDAE